MMQPMFTRLSVPSKYNFLCTLSAGILSSVVDIDQVTTVAVQAWQDSSDEGAEDTEPEVALGIGG